MSSLVRRVACLVHDDRPVPAVRVRAVPSLTAEGAALAKRLGVPFGPGPARTALVLSTIGLHATRGADGDAERLAATGLVVDFGQRRPGAEPLVRAIRGRSGDTVRVVDATAGLGGDAGALYRAGLEVVMIERDPVVAALLDDGLVRLRQSDPEASRRLVLRVGDAAAILPAMDRRPDAIYLDPMYPPARGGAKRRAGAWLRAYLGHDAGADEEGPKLLLQIARSVALRRVVVKRPSRAAAMAPGRSGSIAGSTTRFDLYAPLA